MKNLFSALQLLLLANFSCKGQYYDSIYVHCFAENKDLFERAVSYLKTQRNNINFSNNKAVVLYDTSLLNNPKYISSLKEPLIDLFSANKFKAISYYSSGDIEFLMNFKIDKYTSTETKMLILFTDNKELPVPFIHWQKHRKIEDHWWYLENTDSQY